MEGKRNIVWKNRRRKSLYTLEIEDVGLLYRKESEPRYLTRSQGRRRRQGVDKPVVVISEVNDSVKQKRIKFTPAGDIQDSFPSNEDVLHKGEADTDRSSSPKTLGKSTEDQHVCESRPRTRAQVRNQASAKRTISKSSAKRKQTKNNNNSLEANEDRSSSPGVCESRAQIMSQASVERTISKGSTKQRQTKSSNSTLETNEALEPTVEDKAANGSVNLYGGGQQVDEEQDRHMVEAFCDCFIEDLRKDITESAELDQEKFEKSLSELRDFLLSSNIFRKALEEPIVLLTPHAHDLEDLKRTQENKLEKVCTELKEWEKLGDLLSEEEKTSKMDCEQSILNRNELETFLNPDQLKILENLEEEIKGTDHIETAIAETDQLLKALEEQVLGDISAITQQLDTELDRLASIQLPCKTPRTLLGQLKTS